MVDFKIVSSPLPPHAPRVTIEMGGANVVIRPSSSIDRAYTDALVHAVNAAVAADTAVVIDPEPIRCDDTFAAHASHAGHNPPSTRTGHCALDVEVVASGMIRVAAESTKWTIDLNKGRFVRSDHAIDIRFVDPDAWTPVIAVCITPNHLCALTLDHSLITSSRETV